MHYADDGFVTVRRALSGFVNSVQKRDSLYCVPVAFLRFATIDNESANNAEMNISRTWQANEHEYEWSIRIRKRLCLKLFKKKAASVITDIVKLNQYTINKNKNCQFGINFQLVYFLQYLNVIEYYLYHMYNYIYYIIIITLNTNKKTFSCINLPSFRERPTSCRYSVYPGISDIFLSARRHKEFHVVDDAKQTCFIEIGYEIFE